MNVKDFVIQELKRVIPKKETGGSVVILCPWHREKSPSFSINVEPSNRRVPLGFGHCFGCGARKNWNEIAKELNLKEIKGLRKDGTLPAEYVVALDGKMKDQLLGNASLTFAELESNLGGMLSYLIEPEDKWRGFRGKLLRKIGCQITVDDYDNKCLILPVVIDGEIIGGQKALWTKIKSKKVSSYFNMPGDWILNKGLFPYDYTEKLLVKSGKDYVVLVEGARDALRLLRRGIPALAILGTNNWGKQKRALVLNLPINRVVIMMDADAPGVKASNAIMKSLKGKITRHLIKLKDIEDEMIKRNNGNPLKEHIDPGNLPSKYMNRIIKEIDFK